MSRQGNPEEEKGRPGVQFIPTGEKWPIKFKLQFPRLVKGDEAS
jgi:hypothetical protein